MKGSLLILTTVMMTFMQEAHGAFFVCPKPCQAMYLPRDMETIDDCLCPDGTSKTKIHDNQNANMAHQRGINTLFRCPQGSAAKILHPLSFVDCECNPGLKRDDRHKQCVSKHFHCQGRYALKEGLPRAKSMADCECTVPYVKDEATGECRLDECPRAGNYIQKKSSNDVQSLADCTCLRPFVKNEQSGECLVQDQYKCPPRSHSSPDVRPQSFDDCHCDFGFVRTRYSSCVAESTTYYCPPNSQRRGDLEHNERPKSFHDCECYPGDYVRNDDTQSCDDVSPGAEAQNTESFSCPPYSRALASHPKSIDQCECLPGFGLQVPHFRCVRLSGYKCPPHSYKSSVKHVEESFDDCTCAVGFHRDEESGACLEFYLTNENGCPEGAFLMHWPLQGADNCKCIYGFDNTDHADSQRWTCSHPAHEIFECPNFSYLNTWPLTTNQDCTCHFGFEKAQPNGPVQCVRMSNHRDSPRCTGGEVVSKFDGECRLPVEEVRYEAYGPQDSHTGELVFMGIEYDYVLVEENIMVVQGDVAIGELVTPPKPVLGGRREAGDMGEDRTAPPGSAHILHGYFNLERDHRWRNGEMCYEIDRSAREFRDDIEEAMEHVTKHTGFSFRMCGRTGSEGSCAEERECADYVSFTATKSSCWSYIGRIGGKQRLGVSRDCGVGNIKHELLHAIGLHHTMDRPDRDDHIRVAWECLPESKRSYFIVEQLSNSDFNNSFVTDVPYDFYSIMHHPSDAFVHSPDTRSRKRNRHDRNHEMPEWCRSVFPLIADRYERNIVLAEMGQREKLTLTDVHYVWNLYPFLKSRVRQEDLPLPENMDMHTSRLHTQKDVFVDEDDLVLNPQGELSYGYDGYARSSRIGNAIGAFVTVCALFAFIGFAIVEFRKRSQRGKDNLYYNESLLSEKLSYD